MDAFKITRSCDYPASSGSREAGWRDRRTVDHILLANKRIGASSNPWRLIFFNRCLSNCLPFQFKAGKNPLLRGKIFPGSAGILRVFFRGKFCLQGFFLFEMLKEKPYFSNLKAKTPLQGAFIFIFEFRKPVNHGWSRFSILILAKVKIFFI